MAKEPGARTLEAWCAAINQSGVKKIRARALLRLFGAQRRGAAVVARIQDFLKAQSPPLFANGLEFIRTLDESVELSHVKLTQLGALVEEEKTLMPRFEAEIAPRIGKLRVVKFHFRPEGTKDVLDVLCVDKVGIPVVVELKKADGERRVVEQVLRYMRHIDKDSRYGKAPSRAVIITGRADLPTRRALERLEPGKDVAWYVYGIDPSDKILLKKVTVAPK
ncbi:MAG: endonuclease NucS [Polyangiaceae bacterium]